MIDEEEENEEWEADEVGLDKAELDEARDRLNEEVGE
jgi:hypothetical protein